MREQFTEGVGLMSFQGKVARKRDKEKKHPRDDLGMFIK